MHMLSELLPPHRVQLGLGADEAVEAVAVVLESLRGEPAVNDFAALGAVIAQRAAAEVDCGAARLLVAHGRTEAVQSLVLAAGRFDAAPGGIPLLVFTAGIPAAFQTDYLRVVGVIARVCRQTEGLAALLAAPSPASFVGVLQEAEVSL
jgi:PTS system nitrogen regulatory IIA component